MTDAANQGGQGGQQGSQQGGQGSPWYGELPATAPPEFKEWLGAKNYSDPAAALNAHFNLEKLMGADKAGRTIMLPKDEKDAEGIKAFRAKLGVPENADDYKLPVPEGGSEDLAKFMQGLFHANAVPLSAAQKITEAWNGHIQKMIEEQDLQARAASEKELAALKGEWGNDFDQNTEFARRFLKSSGLNDEQVAKIEGAIGTTAMLKTFHAWGSKTGEHKVGSEGSGGGDFRDKAALNSQLTELRNKRLAGEVTEQQYLSEAERLGRMIAA